MLLCLFFYNYAEVASVFTAVCVCVVIPSILDVSLVDAPAEVTQEEGHTEFLIHLPSAVLALLFLARRIQPSLTLVDREVYRILCTNDLIVLHSSRGKIAVRVDG